MPTRPITQEDADLIRIAGVDPNDYVIDQESGEAVPKAEFDTWGGVLKEGGKAALRSARDMAAGAIEFPGTVADAIRARNKRRFGMEGATGDVQVLPGETRSIFKPMAEAVRSVGSELLAPGPVADEVTAQRIAQKVGGAIGSIGAMAGPGLVTRGASRLAQSIPIAAATLSGAEDVNKRAIAQGASEEEAANQGLKYLPVSIAENIALARFGPQMGGFMARRLKRGGTAGSEAAQGAVGAATDELTQQRLSGEDLNVAQAGETALLGGLAQGTVAGAGKLALNRGRKGAGETEDLAAIAAGDPEVKPQEPVEIIADTALEARIAARLDAQGRGERYDTIKPTPVDLVFQEAQKRKIPMDSDMLRALEEIYAGNDANEAKVFEAARVLLDQGRVARPTKTEPTPEMVERQNAELEKIDARLDQVTKRKDVILEAQKKRAEETIKKPPGADAGDVWLQLANERAATEKGELALLEQQAAQLIEQRKLLTSGGNVTPEGGPLPVAEGPMPPGVLTAEQAQAQKAGRLLTAEEAGAQNLEAIRKQGEEASAAERAKLAGELTPAQKALMEQAEGEQGLPFSGDKTTETYGTLVPPSLLKAFEDKGVRAADPNRLLNLATEHQLAKVARKAPLGAYVADRVQTTLFRARNSIKNRKLKEFETLQATHKGLLEDPRYLKWANEAHTSKSVDYDKLPAELRPGAKAIDDFKKSFHDEQRKRGVHVKEVSSDGKTIYRPPQDVEGYGMYSVDPEVYKAAEEGGPKWAEYENAWVENWIQQGGTKEEAQRTLAEFIGYATQPRRVGGEPLFSAVRNQIGKPLPESWRSKNLVDSINHYIDSWAKDIAYAEVIQNNPLMRKAFGIRQDSRGVDTTLADTNYKPTKAEWALMIDRGRRADAPWARDIKPNMPLGNPLLGDVSFGENLFASYSERPLSHSKAGKLMETANQVSATAMLQHTSKIRNVAQSAFTALDYVPWSEGVPVFRAVLDSIVNPLAAIERSRKAGAQHADVVQHEFAEALSAGAYKTLRWFRKWTGLNGLDAYAKALAYNMAEAGVRAQAARRGADSPLIKEFASFDKLAKGGNLEDLITEAASNIANRVDPAFDIRSLPGRMIPQNRGFLANMYRLMTWSVGRYNHWYTDYYLPAVTGGDKTRLLKSLLTMSLGAAATQEFLAWLQGKMPRDLSLAEWMKLDTKKQQEEFAPMLFGYLQAQGSMGILGDIMYAGVRAAKGRPITQDYTQPMLPGFLVASQFGGTLYDFMHYASVEKGGVENIDLTDLMKLGVEMAKINQTARVTLGRGDDWLPERLKTEADEAKLARERRVFEETTNRSALTGELRGPSSTWGSTGFKPNPFSMQKEFNLREGEDFRKLLPVAEGAARRGATFRTEAGILSPSFYRDVQARRGSTVAQQIVEQSRQKENERRLKRPLARKLNQISSRVRVAED